MRTTRASAPGPGRQTALIRRGSRPAGRWNPAFPERGSSNDGISHASRPATPGDRVPAQMPAASNPDRLRASGSRSLAEHPLRSPDDLSRATQPDRRRAITSGSEAVSNARRTTVPTAPAAIGAHHCHHRREVGQRARENGAATSATPGPAASAVGRGLRNGRGSRETQEIAAFIDPHTRATAPRTPGHQWPDPRPGPRNHSSSRRSAVDQRR